MKIKKLGHCCLVVEINDKRIMIDPGFDTRSEQINEFNISVMIISHGHPNHFHLESVKKIIINNPGMVVITNADVGKVLNEEKIKYEILKNRVPKEFFGIAIEAHDSKHEEIFQEIDQVQHTAYFVDRKLFYPGDSFYNPDKPIEILALPVAGPWARVKDAMKYALEVKPKICFPIHDGTLKAFGLSHSIPNTILPKFGILFKSFEENKEEEF